MEGPGMSSLQGAASIHTNNSAQDRLKEQEELEDRKRRNEEIDKAFDDLVEDAEASSVNSPPSLGKLSTLKKDLSHYKEQMQKITTFQEEIAKRDKEIELHRNRETELQAKLEKHTSMEMQINDQLSVLQNKVDLFESNFDNKLLEYYKQLTERLLQELQEACSSRDSVSRELKDLQSETQKEKELFKSKEKEYVERLEKESQHIEKISSELIRSKEELESANERMSELQKEFTDKQKQFADRLNKFLTETQESNEALMRQLKFMAQFFQKCVMDKCNWLCEQLTVAANTDTANSAQLPKTFDTDDYVQSCHDADVEELKGKAESFQQCLRETFRRLREQLTVATNTDTSAYAQLLNTADSDADDCVQNCRKAFAAEMELTRKEKPIRDQIAERFALEMKTIEINSAREIKEIGNEYHHALANLKEILERKANQVVALKDFVLYERSNFTRILESKDKEISELIKEYHEAEARETTWKLKAERYEDQILVLSNLKESLREERDDFKLRCDIYVKVCQDINNELTEVQAELTAVKERCETYDKEYQAMHEKYKSYKNNVLNYKIYITEKNTHVSVEINRIQAEYNKLFQTHNMNRSMMEEPNQENISAAQDYDFTKELNGLNEECSKLAQLIKEDKEIEECSTLARDPDSSN